MLDESMFEDIHEIAENSAYLKAVEEKDVCLDILHNMPPYSECGALEQQLRLDAKLSFQHIFSSATGYYCLKCFLIADYASEKAVFLKDVEAYKKMRFESARKKIANLMYERYIAPLPVITVPSSPTSTGNSTSSSSSSSASTNSASASLTMEPTTMIADMSPNFPKGVSVFQMIMAKDKATLQPTIVTPSNNTPNNINNAAQLATHTNGSSSPVPPGGATANSDGVSTTSAINNKGVPSTNSMASQSSASLGHVSTELTTVGPHSITSSSSSSASSSASSTTSSTSRHRAVSMLSIGSTNAIGVYGSCVRKVRHRLIERGEAPADLFDEAARDVKNDLMLDVLPRFLVSDFYKKYIRTKAVELRGVNVQDFTTFRVLGRGGFGAVHACRKKNSGAIYAQKAISKRLVKVKCALDNVLEERNVLTLLRDSAFITNLKYALQDEEQLYLVMDLMVGGDLKFHLINAGRFTEKRARFYAAEVLLGLEHIHRMQIIYRDMKLENVLLDHNGHCKISDLGLAVVTKVKIKGYAGTPGYTAPEMIKNKLYGPSADIFSFGVMLYRMLCGSKPFKGKIDRDLDKAVLEKKPVFPKEIFSTQATALLTALLAKRPEHRLGCGERGIEEIKEHPFFESIDWGLLEAGYLDPPFQPNKLDVNAASLKDIGDFDKAKYKHVKLDDRFRARCKNFEYVSVQGLQEELVAALEKAEEHVNFEKFAPPTSKGGAGSASQDSHHAPKPPVCCCIQ